MTSEQQALGPNELYDIYGMWHVPWWQSSTWYYIVGFLFISASICGIWFTVRCLRAKKSKQPSWERALARLEVLRVQAHPASGRVFYHMLTQLIKEYLQERYELNLTGKTDDEFIACLIESTFSPTLLAHIKTVFEESITIKFSHVQVSQERIDRDFALGYTIIKQSIPPR